jgi:hypothetical protein
MQISFLPYAQQMGHGAKIISRFMALIIAMVVFVYHYPEMPVSTCYRNKFY